MLHRDLGVPGLLPRLLELGLSRCPVTRVYSEISWQHDILMCNLCWRIKTPKEAYGEESPSLHLTYIQ
jgi:hypothetical protein